MSSPRIRRLWRGKCVGCPNPVGRFNACDILELQSADLAPELRIDAITGVDDDDTAWQARFARPLNLLQCDLWFCLKFYILRYARCSNDWCCAAVRVGAVNAAMGSTLLRWDGNNKPVQ